MLQNPGLFHSYRKFSWLLRGEDPGKQEKKNAYLRSVRPSSAGVPGTLWQRSFANRDGAERVVNVAWPRAFKLSQGDRRVRTCCVQLRAPPSLDALKKQAEQKRFPFCPLLTSSAVRNHKGACEDS